MSIETNDLFEKMMKIAKDKEEKNDKLSRKDIIANFEVYKEVLTTLMSRIEEDYFRIDNSTYKDSDIKEEEMKKKEKYSKMLDMESRIMEIVENHKKIMEDIEKEENK